MSENIILEVGNIYSSVEIVKDMFLYLASMIINKMLLERKEGGVGEALPYKNSFQKKKKKEKNIYAKYRGILLCLVLKKWSTYTN